MDEVSLKELKLHKSDSTHRLYDYYLSATYTVETDKEIRELRIPKMELPLPSNALSMQYSPDGARYVELIEDRLVIPSSVWVREEVIKTKTKKMTLKEIEKKLGHKIELISEEE